MQLQPKEQRYESFPSMPLAQIQLTSYIIKSFQHLQPTRYTQPFPTASGFSDTVCLPVPNSTRGTRSFKSSPRNYENLITDLTAPCSLSLGTSLAEVISAEDFFFFFK